MKKHRGAVLLLIFYAGVVVAGDTGAAARAGIATFNRALIAATTRMDNAATVALWDEAGVSLLPSTQPLVGKQAIGKFLDDVMASLAGAQMAKFEMQCFDVTASGDWASEWCREHQIVSLPDGKPPFEGWGTMLLVLHRGADGNWRLKREMWNQALAPDPPATSP